MANARIGYGVKFQRETTTPGTYEDIGELIEPGAPGLARDAVDATHAASPDAYREFISGLRDGGEVALTLALLPTNAAQRRLYDDFNDNAAHKYKVLFPNVEQTSWSFDGLITALTPALPIDDRMTLAVTVKVSGKPVLADAA
ncbi:phage tail tube protein [Rhodoligotrophos defluvii]|uniref:phage tail tube protein n=1 Tax=Rhodoligotrophos defluvii TaxID=2561934 RepID=UPI0010C93C0D|nr:phage tail tube protein [Rhodoligotrophos defluvii]